MGAWWRRLVSQFLGAADPSARQAPRENAELLAQRFATVRGRLTSIDVPAADEGARHEAYLRVRDILDRHDAVREGRASAPAPGWSDLSLAEQLLVRLISDEDVPAEIEDQLLQLLALSAARHAPHAAAWERLRSADPFPAARARGLLAVVLRRVQWESSQRYYTRLVGVTYAGRLVVSFAVAILIAAALVLWELNVTFSPIPGGRFGGFTLALAGGLLGASFSMLTRQREIAALTNLEEIHTAAGYPMILLRLGVGVGAACTLYFLFNADLISGMLFPDLSRIGFVPVSVAADAVVGADRLGAAVPNVALAKLVVWSFAAGFSEQLVPTLLARIGSEAEKPRAKS